MKTSLCSRHRSGTILVFTLLMMIGILGMLALAVDIGYLESVRSQLQRSADAAAIAAAHELIREEALAGQNNPPHSFPGVCSTASRYAGLNTVARAAPALASEDVTIGQLQYPFTPDAAMTFTDTSRFNAVSVRVRRTAAQNGEVSLFFAKMLGFSSRALQADATAAFANNFRGFRIPAGGTTVAVLPFALDKTTWDNLLAGGGTDNWGWDEETGQVTAYPDGIREVNLYPQGTGSPGNRGTVDVGNPNNSTADIARQILHGVSAQDLAYIGGKLELGPDGTLTLEADTGISAGIKDELAAIKGQTRTILVFSQVAGCGNNAHYTIVEFAGVRIMDVRLTGSPSNKRVIVQPATVVAPGAIPSSESGLTSYGVYSPVWLVH